MSGTHLPAAFHPATVAWFRDALGTPTSVQSRAWDAIATGAHTLVAAPTGSGKTLAAFLHAIDALVQEATEGPLPDQTRILYVSPLKALGNDVEKNLAGPLAAIAARAMAYGQEIRITTAVRTGDTPAAARARMVRRPPHLLVTTPEGLYALLTSRGGRQMLGDVRTVIVDEIHALAPDRRGAHLALSLERLDALVTSRGARPVQRIGLSATQSPIEDVAAFLAGTGRPCTIVDEGHHQPRELRLELPGSPLGAVMTTSAWDVLIDRVAALVKAHTTTIVFVNSRRLSERVAHLLAARLGADAVAAHHGSLAPALRLDAEARLKAGSLRALVATASLELGLDIGDVDLVVQLGAVKRIATLLQRVGRANHRAGGVPKGYLVPLTRDDLVECAALLRAAEDGTLDRVSIPAHPLDVLAQQLVATCVTDAWTADALYRMVTLAHPYRALSRDTFDRVITMLTEGFPTERGRRGQLLTIDPVTREVMARRGAGLTALSSGGTIPDSGDYPVRLEPDGVVVGAVAEDFAIHQLPGHVIQLGSNSWRILRVAAGEVRVERAPNETPYMPVWFGEQPPRSTELTQAVAALRAEVASASTRAEAVAGLLRRALLDDAAAAEVVDYLHDTRQALGVVPAPTMIVAERFPDDAGGQQLIVHAPVGVRITRAWAVALRHELMTRHGVELQATAIDDGLLLSLPGSVTFPLAAVFSLITAASAAMILEQAVFHVPLFMVRWRWVASRALLVPRMRAGRRVPPHLQRTDADELLLSALGDHPARRAVGQPWRIEAKQGGAASVRPLAEPDASSMVTLPNAGTESPLLAQTLRDCLEDAMDLHGLEQLLGEIERGTAHVRAVERDRPSPAAFALVTARPPAYVDNGALMDRRTRTVRAGRDTPAVTGAPLASLGHLRLDPHTAVHPEAVDRVRREVAPDFSTAEDALAQLLLCGVITAVEVASVHGAGDIFDALEARGAAVRLRTARGLWLWGAMERRRELAAVYPEAGVSAVTAERSVTGERDVEVVAQLLAGRLEMSGPVTVEVLAAQLDLPPALIEAALHRLVTLGSVVQGRHDPARRDQDTWCDRRVLARIERLTRNRLRAEIEPVDLDTYRRFLFRWQGVTPASRRTGRDGLAAVLDMLDGVELPAALWEASVLPIRVSGYDLGWLDALCLSGAFGWGRRSPSPSPRHGMAKAPALTRSTPLALYRKEHEDTWRSLARGADEASPVEARWSVSGQAVEALLERRGPIFLSQMERLLNVHRTGELPQANDGLSSTQLELALLELTAAGRLTADAFAAVRGLLARPAKWGIPRLVRLANTNTGRWSLVAPPESLRDPVARSRAVEQYARALLRRYGIVVRPVVQHDSAGVASVRWSELLRVLRRFEARGEVRGGFFVRGAGGEHFALPEAVHLLREVDAERPAGELVALTSADPLNLTGVFGDTPRIASRSTVRILFEDAQAVALLEGRRVVPLRTHAALTAAHLQALHTDPAPATLAAYS